VKNGEWSEVTIFGKMYILSLIYSYIAVCRYCVIHCVIIIYSLCYFLINRLTFLIFFLCLLSDCMFVFYFVYSVFLYYFMYYFSFSIHSCPFPIFVQVYQPLPLGGNPNAVNEYNIISYHTTYLTACGVISDL
jgi:hypothetical protein